MIKLFPIKAKAFWHNQEQESAIVYVGVQADKPNILQAIEIAKDYANDFIAHEYDYRDYSCKFTPHNGGCGIPFKEYMDEENGAYNDIRIVNLDDIYDMDFDYDDLGGSALANANECLTERHEQWTDAGEETYGFIEKKKCEDGLVIDYDDCYWSLGYVQGDYGRVEKVDFVDGLVDYLDKHGFKWGKHPGFEKWLIKECYVESDYNSGVTVYNLDIRNYKHINETMDELAGRLEDFFMDFLDDLGKELYSYVRDSYEWIWEDEHKREFANDNDFTFTIDGDLND